MGPRRARYWLPLTRLGAFFVAVVVAGNVVLHALRPKAADLTTSQDQSVDYFGRKKKRLERQFYRTMEKFLGSPVVAPVKDKISLLRPEAPPVLCLAPAVEPVASAPATPLIPPPPAAARLGFIEPEAAPFAWPAPLPPLAPREFDLPSSLTMAEETAFRAELVAQATLRGRADCVADVGDAILKGPEMILDAIFVCTSSLGTRRSVRNWEDDDDRSIISQILDVQVGSRKERIWSEFMTQWTQREIKYLANFGDSRANTHGFEDRTAEADLHELALDQRKVFWDALRRTYLARYKVQAEEKIRDEAWYLDRWSGADFVLLPPLLGGYVFYRGLDKRFNVVGTKLTLSIEPVSEWYRGSKRDLPAMIALEWSMKGCPLGVIVSAGLHEGKYGMDFVGIGTSLGAARRTLVMQQGERR